MMQIERINYEKSLIMLKEHIYGDACQELWDWVQQFTEPLFYV